MQSGSGGFAGSGYEGLKGALRNWLLSRHGHGHRRTRLEPVVVDKRGRRVRVLQAGRYAEILVLRFE